MSDNLVVPDREKRMLSGPAMIVLLFLFLILGILLSFSLGRYPVPIKELAAIILDRLPFVNLPCFWEHTQEIAVWNVRMPRILIAVLVGGALSAAGACYQGVFQNPMAAPDILGASAGAGFGAALAILCDFNSSSIPPWPLR